MKKTWNVAVLKSSRIVFTSTFSILIFEPMNRIYSMAIHGGAGTIDKSLMTPELEQNYIDGLRHALKAGDSVLKHKGSAMDAVIASVVSLENNPLFNAGRGSVFNHQGKQEMDASLMTGKDLKAGAVSGVMHIKNPVLLAKAVMQHSGHVLLCGEGAEEFAKEQGLEFESEAYFYTDHRFRQWQELKGSNQVELDHGSSHGKIGTVGAVALDMDGNLAAATSTGGMSNKRYGRIGDTPLIGSGTYANNATCAISCTGHGEYYMRSVAAYDISCLMEYRGLSLRESCRLLVMDKLVKMGGEGGLIAADRDGNIEMPFNSSGMYRAACGSSLKEFIGIYR